MSKKDKFLDLGFILLLTILFCIPLYQGSLYTGADIGFHITRIKNISDGLRTRTFPVYVYPYINNGFGYGSPMFYCDLFLIPSALLYMLGMPIVMVWKITLFTYALIACIATYHLSKVVFESKMIQIFCTVIYIFSNVRINYYYYGSGLGNIIALSFLPLLLLAFYKLFVLKENCFKLLGISYALLLLSHVLTFTITVIFLVLLLIIDIKNIDKERILCITKAALLAMALSAWFLFPCIEQLLSQEFWSSFLNDTTNLGYFKESQRPILQVFSDYIFNTSPNQQYLGIIYSIGGILCYLAYKIKNKFKQNMVVDVMALVLMGGVFLEIDILPLYKISILRHFQFIWRINIILAPIAVFVIGKAVNELKMKNIIVSLMSIYLIINVAYMYKAFITCEDNWPNEITYEEIKNKGISILDDTHGFNLVELGQGEYLPLTNSYDYYKANTNIEFANEESAVWDFNRTGTTITFTTNYDWSDYIYMPLSYYKGYYYQELDDNGDVLYEKECISNIYSKRVGMYMEDGVHNYRVYYKGTVVQHVTFFVSLLSFIAFISYKSKLLFRRQIKGN